MTFEESVRKRPFMYIGNDDIIGILDGLITYCFEVFKTDKVTFEIVILGENDFSFGFTSTQNINPFIQEVDENKESAYYFPNILKIVSDTFKIFTEENSKTGVIFSLDKKVIPETNVDYLKLNEKVMQIALLNRQCEIITKDERQKYNIQNYYHFPQGVFYLFDRILTEVLGKPKFRLTFDSKVNSNQFQIGLAYRTDWYPTPYIKSFANNVYTICGGSLVDGILEGVIDACKTYVKENNLITHKISKKKFLNGLIIVCAVRGKDFKYNGSFKEALEDSDVKLQAKRIIKNLALQFFNSNKEDTDNFLLRFNTSQLTSGIF